MDFEYREGENQNRQRRDPTPEDDRFVGRRLITVALICVLVLLLIYLLGGSFPSDPAQMPPPA